MVDLAGCQRSLSPVIILAVEGGEDVQVWLGLVSDNCKETEIKFPIKKLQTTDIDIIAYNNQGNYTDPSPSNT